VFGSLRPTKSSRKNKEKEAEGRRIARAQKMPEGRRIARAQKMYEVVTKREYKLNEVTEWQIAIKDTSMQYYLRKFEPLGVYMRVIIRVTAIYAYTSYNIIHMMISPRGRSMSKRLTIKYIRRIRQEAVGVGSRITAHIVAPGRIRTIIIKIFN
jgi:hypothetical protein